MWGYLERDVAAHVGKETIKKAEIQDQIDYYIQMYQQYGKKEIQDQIDYYIQMYQQYGIDLTDPSYSEMRTNLEKNIKDSVINQSLLVQYAEAQHLMLLMKILKVRLIRL